jgi:hypothetical protein
LKSLGLEVVDIECFDYDRFVCEGFDYLREEFGEEVAKEIIEKSDIDKEFVYARQLLSNGILEKRVPKFKEILGYLKKGYVPIICVNSRMIDQKEGYAGHYIVVTGFSKDQEVLIIHDPGLPGFPDRQVSFEVFNKAWAYPNNKAKNILVVKG